MYRSLLVLFSLQFACSSEMNPSSSTKIVVDEAYAISSGIVIFRADETVDGETGYCPYVVSLRDDQYDFANAVSIPGQTDWATAAQLRYLISSNLMGDTHLQALDAELRAAKLYGHSFYSETNNIYAETQPDQVSPAPLIDAVADLFYVSPYNSEALLCPKGFEGALGALESGRRLLADFKETSGADADYCELEDRARILAPYHVYTSDECQVLWEEEAENP